MCGSNDNLPVFAGTRMQTQGPGTGQQNYKMPTNKQEMFELARTNKEYASNMDLDQMFGGQEAANIRNNLGIQSRNQQPQPGAGRKMGSIGTLAGKVVRDQRQPETAQRDYNRSTQFVDSLLDIFNPQKAGTQTTTQQNLPDWAIPDAMSTLGMGNYYTQNPDYRPGSLDRDYSAVRGLNQYGEPISQAGSFGLAPAGFQPQTRPNSPSNNQDDLVAQRQPGGQFGNWDWDSSQLLRSSLGDLPRSSRGGGRYAAPTTGPGATPGGDLNNTAPGGQSSGETKPRYSAPTTGPAAKPGGDLNSTAPGGSSSNSSNSSSSQTNTQSSSSSTTPKPESKPEPEPEPIDPKTIFDPDNVTPFAYYDRQRFAAPGAGTVRGEGLLQGRYDQRFGPSGTNPFSSAQNAINQAADFRSGYTGTTTTAGGYQAGLANAQDPGVFAGKSYADQNLQNTFSNPNAGMGNVNAGMRNVNAGMAANQYGNANQGLAGPVDYQQQKTLQQGMQQFMNPYTDQVVNQSLKDLDRARIMSNQNISSSAAKAGAFGGSREALMRSENNRNFLDRAGALSGQLRQQGFQTASQLAQDENLKRLGLSASDLQNTRGFQSAGNLQGQNLTARDAQNVRGLQSQGALAAQGLQSQGGLAAQGLTSQGALAALGANANLYGQGLGLGAGMDRAALQANAGLLSDAMGLDASDLRQRRDIASNEAQFQENALRGAGALNLQGGNALANLAQYSTADERQRISDLMRGAAGQDMRNQQDLDFIRSEFDRELQYPGYQIDLRNRAISPATNSVVTQTQDVYGRSPLSNIAALAALYYGAA